MNRKRDLESRVKNHIIFSFETADSNSDRVDRTGCQSRESNVYDGLFTHCPVSFAIWHPDLVRACRHVLELYR